jgi:hypothetical protein
MVWPGTGKHQEVRKENGKKNETRKFSSIDLHKTDKGMKVKLSL